MILPEHCLTLDGLQFVENIIVSNDATSNPSDAIGYVANITLDAKISSKYILISFAGTPSLTITFRLVVVVFFTFSETNILISIFIFSFVLLMIILSYKYSMCLTLSLKTNILVVVFVQR